MNRELSKTGREQLALALILLKDFKADGKFNVEVTRMVFELAQSLGVTKEYDELMCKIPPMRITPR